jgi:hypothetical protein
LQDSCRPNIDGFVKSPSAALRFTFVVEAYFVSTPHSGGIVRLASGSFYFAIQILAFYEFINIGTRGKAVALALPPGRMGKP